MSRNYLKVAIVLAIVLVLACAVPALAKGPGGGGDEGGETTAGNNLSFPAIAADGVNLSEVEESFTVPYLNPDGTLFEIDGVSPWYAQKVEGNAWNADYVNLESEDTVAVFGVDWGDNTESVKPTVGRPYRLEMALFADRTSAPMQGYVMGMLANPSSPDEIQGTSTEKYDSNYATITSPEPKLRIQDISGIDLTTLTWDAESYAWISSEQATIPETTIAFAPELNVGGKYIFGASEGGWKPAATGTFRITFYIPTTSQIEMDETTTLGNLVNGSWASGPAGELGVLPVVESGLNLTYVDLTVIAKGGGGGGHKPR